MVDRIGREAQIQPWNGISTIKEYMATRASLQGLDMEHKAPANGEP